MAFAAGMLCCAFAMMGSNFPLLVAGFMLLGLMYGGNMCSMSAMVGTFFGPKYYGINYAIATCQMIPAAIVGPQILALSQMGSIGPPRGPGGEPERPSPLAIGPPTRARPRRLLRCIPENSARLPN